MIMDDIDLKLIGLLRADARATALSLARRLGVSRGTVQNRMARLERDGAILGYTVRLAEAIDEPRVAALMNIAVDSNREDAVRAALQTDPAVRVLHSTTGRWDLVVELHAPTLAAFDRVLERIRRVEGIARTETSILLSSQTL
jgi:DNA-binding Lrp family transcriptional regulator